MGRIVCFGELLLRLTAPGRELLLQTGRLDVHVGGAEANVAVGLARLGHETAMISRLPGNALGEAALSHLRRYGVATDGVATGAGADGTLFPVAGRGSSGLRYRLRPRGEQLRARRAGRFRLGAAARGRRPAASFRDHAGARPEHRAEAAVAAAEAARAKGIPVSFDGNYRAQLWERWDSDPKAVLGRLVGQAEILFGNHRDISLLLGRAFSGEGEERRREAAEAMFAQFPGLKLIASTARHIVDADTPSHLRPDRQRATARRRPSEIVVAGIVDRIGAGDAFAAGILHGLRTGLDLERIVKAGLALTCLKHSLRRRCEPVRAA